MGRTSLSVFEETRGDVDNLRLPAHDNLGEVVRDLAYLAPDAEEFEDGCQNPECDRRPRQGDQFHDSGFIFQPYHREYTVNGETSVARGVSVYCSADCLLEVQEQVDTFLPKEPDEVRVGGRSMMQAKFSGARYVVDGETHQLSIPIPGALAGESSHGIEYEYEGEPVYIMDEEEGVVQSYVVEELVHEETHTAVLLGHDYPVEMYHHPDDEARRNYREQFQKQTTTECVSCGSEVFHAVSEPPEDCPACGESGWLG